MKCFYVSFNKICLLVWNCKIFTFTKKIETLEMKILLDTKYNINI